MVKMEMSQVVGVLFLVACNVPAPSGGTGGVGDGAGGDAGVAAMTIVCSDFKSTSIALADSDGTIVSGSFVSSGSTRPGLTLALSGDIDVPFVAPLSGRVLLIDRSSFVLTWMDPATAKVIAQLPVGTGFMANPHDYVEVDATHALVSRYGTNPTPGRQSFDQGGDLLVVDTSTFAVSGRVAIPEEDRGLQPCPDVMNWLGTDVVVTLGRISAVFSTVGDGRFVGVSPSTQQIDWTVTVTGLQTCGRVVTSPSGALAAIACSSTASMTGVFDVTKSDIVVYDATVMPPKELRRLGVASRLGSAVQPQIAFATENAILALTYGGNATAGDTVIAVNATTGDVTSLATDTMPFELGGVRCSPGAAGDVCLVGDAELNVLRRWQVSVASSGLDGGADVDAGAIGATFTARSNVVVDPTIGLPPRDIGGL